jgi:hypothetical protein
MGGRAAQGIPVDPLPRGDMRCSVHRLPSSSTKGGGGLLGRRGSNPADSRTTPFLLVVMLTAPSSCEWGLCRPRSATACPSPLSRPVVSSFRAGARLKRGEKGALLIRAPWRAGAPGGHRVHRQGQRVQCSSPRW